ncbi:hypothetical protein NDU88_006442 [Pleurodeles waltl]|uniref:Uncharacterized protein n=1 Tax=Pleurodeles waltl TaxID=8319 RepID=A0AAV7UL08_PLEWA|nr:hypothetical protein NDU88_006442 [Pleurodeles waltl]
MEINLERFQRVAEGPPADILVCVHDFQVKETILRKACDVHPFQFRDHAPLLYRDLATIALQKWRNFCPVTAPLRNAGISYS